jgi:hypothetical protein
MALSSGREVKKDFQQLFPVNGLYENHEKQSEGFF